ncbi:hypothetical protein DFJ73DRAFT_833759 [Zopfochytrium polystomum]|nr:hypothetical protein DFJ73DRAFT_833759 [Zopfochytrium polystomum]
MEADDTKGIRNRVAEEADEDAQPEHRLVVNTATTTTAKTTQNPVLGAEAKKRKLEAVAPVQQKQSPLAKGGDSDETTEPVKRKKKTKIASAARPESKGVVSTAVDGTTSAFAATGDSKAAEPKARSLVKKKARSKRIEADADAVVEAVEDVEDAQTEDQLSNATKASAKTTAALEKPRPEARSEPLSPTQNTQKLVPDATTKKRKLEGVAPVQQKQTPLASDEVTEPVKRKKKTKIASAASSESNGVASIIVDGTTSASAVTGDSKAAGPTARSLAKKKARSKRIEADADGVMEQVEEVEDAQTDDQFSNATTAAAKTAAKTAAAPETPQPLARSKPLSTSARVQKTQKPVPDAAMKEKKLEAVAPVQQNQTPLTGDGDSEEQKKTKIASSASKRAEPRASEVKLEGESGSERTETRKPSRPAIELSGFSDSEDEARSQPRKGTADPAKLVRTHLQKAPASGLWIHVDDDDLDSSDCEDGGASKGYNSGRYTERERQLLTLAIAAYISKHSLNVDDLPLLANLRRAKKSEWVPAETLARITRHTRFASKICQESGVKRTPNSVHNWMRAAFHPFRDMIGSDWTPEQDTQLEELVATMGRSWRTIEEEIGKTGCKNRYDILMRKKEGKQDGEWTDEENLRLCAAVMRFANPETGEVANGRWAEIAAAVKTRDSSQCFHRYREYEGDFRRARANGASGDRIVLDVIETAKATSGKKERWTKEDDLRLLNSILTNHPKARDESEINWTELLQRTDFGRLSHVRGASLKSRWLRLQEEFCASVNLGFIARVRSVLSMREAFEADCLPRAKAE